jgi:hypothetical protein
VVIDNDVQGKADAEHIIHSINEKTGIV